MTPTSFIPQQVRAAGLEMKDVLTDIIENKFKKCTKDKCTMYEGFTKVSKDEGR